MRSTRRDRLRQGVSEPEHDGSSLSAGCRSTREITHGRGTGGAADRAATCSEHVGTVCIATGVCPPGMRRTSCPLRIGHALRHADLTNRRSPLDRRPLRRARAAIASRGQRSKSRHHTESKHERTGCQSDPHRILLIAGSHGKGRAPQAS